jgi:hypothetical protein
MSELAGFLAARLDEDEYFARTTLAINDRREREGISPKDMADTYAFAMTVLNDPEIMELMSRVENQGYLLPTDVNRVITEVEAKRKILELHQPGSHSKGDCGCNSQGHFDGDTDPGWAVRGGWTERYCAYDTYDWPCPTVPRPRRRLRRPSRLRPRMESRPVMHALAASGGGDQAIADVLIVLGIIGYWVPSIIAFARHMPNKAAILLIDLFAGWTGVGWLVALVMSVWPKPAPQYVVPPGFQSPPQPWPPGTVSPDSPHGQYLKEKGLGFAGPQPEPHARDQWPQP